MDHLNRKAAVKTAAFHLCLQMYGGDKMNPSGLKAPAGDGFGQVPIKAG